MTRRKNLLRRLLPALAGTWKEKVPRGRHRVWVFTTESGKAAWIVILLISSISLVYTIANYKQNRDEDLRLSVRRSTHTTDRVYMDLHFINLGKQSASIDNIDAYPVVPG